MASSGEATTYSELATQMYAGAHLLTRLGLKPGDGLALLSENNAGFISIYWAAQISGLYFTPISTQLKAAEIEYLLNDCDAEVLVVSSTFQKILAQLAIPQRHVFTMQQWQAECDRPAGNVKPENSVEGAEMLYSSGTTGKPKGVRNSQPGAPLGEISGIMKKRLAIHHIDADCNYLSTAPLYHSAPLRYNQMVLRSGGTSIIMSKFDAQTALMLIKRYQVTHSQWVPTMFIRLLKLPEEIRQTYSPGSHKFAIHAAAPCPVSIKRRMFDWWGPIIYEYYGGTEGNGQTAISPREWLKYPGSVGRSISASIHIQPLPEPGSGSGTAPCPEQEDLPPGEPGLVYFEGGTRFSYYKDEEKTQASQTESGWSTLGDVGYLNHQGYLYLTDRMSFMIISGGVNIYPREVEEVLLTHPCVLDAAVFGVPNSDFGEEVKAAVQLNDNMLETLSIEAQQSLNEQLIEHCKNRLAHLKCPRSIDLHAALPRHQTGKIYKQLLKAAYH